jgi:hypothetical protein
MAQMNALSSNDTRVSGESIQEGVPMARCVIYPQKWILHVGIIALCASFAAAAAADNSAETVKAGYQASLSGEMQKLNDKYADIRKWKRSMWP